ncbi:phage major capsid protein [Paenirhodobacter populi]|nr:phage major capsid protein [Sinirhodobacter populi]
MDRIEIKAQLTVDDAGTITGIAWPFGSADRVGDVIEKGAFASAAVPLPMLDTHDQAKAVGVWNEINETPEGLTVKGRLLIEDVERAREVRALVQAGAMRGLSIGFDSRKAFPRKGGGRTIQGLDLLEISVVAVPAHPGARITSAKDMNMAGENDGIAALEAKVTEIEKKTDTSAITGRLDKIEAKMNRPGGIESKVEKTEEQKAFGAYLRLGDRGLAGVSEKALTVANDATAGYLAPVEFGSEILKALREFSPLRQYARVISIGSTEIVYPRRIGSTAATWVSEVEDRTESGPSYEQVTLTPHELATFTEISKKLLEDNTYNLEGELATDLAESFAIAEGAAFVAGSGAGQPRGILNATGLEVVSSSVAVMDDDPALYDLLVDLFAAIPTAHAQSAAWSMNRKTLARLRKVKDSAGWPIWQPSLAENMPATLLGRPVIEMVDMPDIAAGATPIVFGDWSGYRIVDRVGFSLLVDPYTRAKNGITVFHARKRVGGDVTNPDRFAKLVLS